MKTVPFQENHKDALHCMTATYSMVIQYFTDKKLTWQQLEEMSGFKDGKPAWSMQAFLAMHKLGIDTEMYDSFDYQAYLDKGLDYYKEFLTPEEYDWQMEHAQLPDKQLIPKFLKKINWHCKTADLNDIDRMLSEGKLVGVGLNMQVLNNRLGLTLHEVLVLEDLGDSYKIHDPGPPAQANRKVKKSILFKAMGGKHHNQEVTGFSKL